MKIVWSFALAAGLMAAALAFAQTGTMRLEGRLSGAGNDRGKAKWVVKDIRGQMQAEFEVEGENLAPNETYLIHVGGNTPWSAESDAFGSFELEQRYRGPNRPSIAPGSTVVVTDDAGNTVLTGVLVQR